MEKQTPAVEVWGGIECTINRVKDSYIDQLDFSGHYKRDTDIELIAALGVKKLRYPLIWERHQPTKNTKINWSFAERNINKLNELNIEPIAGLVHHGSGPRHAPIHTNAFAVELATYALKVAEKFPSISLFTPVNEPLTTARFCGLYGHWFPHHIDNKSFLDILVNECKATVLAMEAIRTINPQAKLVQTEDLSKTYSTALLQYQADFENERRWLAFDLISGNVTDDHPLYQFLLWSGISNESIDFFQEHKCPPDILGLNYYPTSERWLDENMQHYPQSSHGGNFRHSYADVEAVRVAMEEPTGAKVLIKEAWERFKIPVAITEVHLGCTRDEQLRWLNNIYTTCCELKLEGCDIKAITAWSMFGTYGWNRLVTDINNMQYEPGVFDLRSETPRPTAIAGMIKKIADGECFDHPVVNEKGWWQRNMRVHFFQHTIRTIGNETLSSQPLFIVGKTGRLGNALARLCELRGLNYKLLSRHEFDICDDKKMEDFIAEKNPWAIINAAGFTQIDEAEIHCDKCFNENTYGPQKIAALAARYNVKFLTFSSAHVFDGTKQEAYIESDPVNALNVYGRSKAMAENLVQQTNSDSLIIRSSDFFGPWDKRNFMYHVLSSLKNNNMIKAANNVFISPTYLPDLVHASLDLLLDNESGIWHLTNNGKTSWYDLAVEVARFGGYKHSLIKPLPHHELHAGARQPKNGVLQSERGMHLPSLENALQRYFNEQDLMLLSAGNIMRA